MKPKPTFYLISLIFSINCVLAQNVELIFPKNGFQEYTEGYFLNETNGFIKSKSGSLFQLKNNEFISNIELSSKQLNLFKKNTAIKLKQDVNFIPFAKFKNKSIGIIKYKPYLVEINQDNKITKILNGLSLNTLCSFVKQNDIILISDSYGAIFKSKDNGKNFEKIINEKFISWPTLKKTKNIFYYIDNNNRFGYSDLIGENWVFKEIKINSLNYNSGNIKIIDLVLKNENYGYFITSINEIYSFNLNDFSIKELYHFNEKNIDFKSINIINDKVIALKNNGEIIYSCDESNWKSKKIDDNDSRKMYSKDDKTVIHSTKNYVIISDNKLRKFKKIEFEAGYKSFFSTIYKNYLIIEYKPENHISSINKILIYNLLTNETKTIPQENFKNKYGEFISGLYDNYILGKFGILMKIDL